MKKRILCLFFAFVLIVLALAGCMSSSSNNDKYDTLQDLSHATIGIVPGTFQAVILPEILPEANYMQFQSISDMVSALDTKKIDAFSVDESMYIALLWENMPFTRINEPVDQSNYGIIFSKNDNNKLREEVNEFIADMKESGELSALERKWFANKEPEDTDIDYESLSGENGTIHIATNSSVKPFAYIKNGKYTGFDIEFLTMFAEKYGYSFSIDDTDISSVIAGTSSGKYDIGSAGFTITDERKESVLFSDVYHKESSVMVVRGEGTLNKIVEDYEESTVGVAVGTYAASIINEVFPKASIKEFPSVTDMMLALSQGKIDICISDVSMYMAMKWEGTVIDRLSEPYEISRFGVAFKKGSNSLIRQQINEYIETIKQNGKYDQLQSKWFGDKEPTEFDDPNTLTGTNGTIKVITCNEVKPFGYVKNGRQVGYDMDFIVSFAREYGYTLDVNSGSFSTVLSGLQAGMYDLAISGLTITEERKETIDFSDPYHDEEMVFVISGYDHDSLETFNVKRLGVVSGSIYEDYSREQFPNATFKEYDTFSDGFIALKQGKIEGIMLDRPEFNSIARTDDKLSYVQVPTYLVDIGFGFQSSDNGHEIRAQMNDFINKSKTSGTIDDMIDKWYGKTEPDISIPLDELSENENKLKVCIDTTRKPFVYMRDGQPVGFEIELLYLFCQEYGYGLELSEMSLEDGLEGLSKGEYDIACGGLYITDELREGVIFGEPYTSSDVVMAKYEKSAFEKIFASLEDSFNKTFIKEERWRLIIEGVLTTLIISVCSIIGGTLLGFLLYLPTRSKYRLLAGAFKIFNKIYSSFISGTPTLVVLMILFYLVFGSSDLSGVIVAIIGFILIFAMFVYNQLTLTVSCVDKGQTEAAYALGYGRNQAFMRIVLPQAMQMFLPTYSGEIVSLIKSTSVVGYIAVNDLTKIGDIIRGSTYEAFFPLISVAAIYFAIIWGITFLLRFIQRKADPKRRKDKNILKGVVR